MPIIDLTKAEWQQVIQLLIQANPLIVKISQQLQEQESQVSNNIPRPQQVDGKDLNVK